MPDVDRKDAELVPPGYDPADLPEHQEIRTCKICQVEFFEKVTSTRLFCGEKHKSKATAIKLWMRRHGYEPNLEAFVADYTAFPSTNARSPNKYGPIKGIVQPIAIKPSTRRTTALQREQAAAEAAQARAEVAKTTVEKEKISLRQSQLRAIEIEANRTEREGIQAASAALKLIPLSEQSDVLSGKKSFLPDTEISIARSQINVIVQNNILIAEKVLSGEVTWSPSQLNLFTRLLNKVVPDAAASKITKAKDRPLSDLSISELEELVSQQKPKVVNP